MAIKTPIVSNENKHSKLSSEDKLDASSINLFPAADNIIKVKADGLYATNPTAEELGALPITGGNVDSLTIDNKLPLTSSATGISNFLEGDIDSYTIDTGLYSTSLNNTGTFPPGASLYGTLIVIKRGDGLTLLTRKCTQIYSDTSNNKVYTRTCDANTSSYWTGWRELLTTDSIEEYQSGLGVSQAWQDVYSDRKLDVAYTNNMGQPIEIKVTCTLNGSGANIYLYINGESVESHQCNTTLVTCITAVIPHNATYKISGNSTIITKWFELR